MWRGKGRYSSWYTTSGKNPWKKPTWWCKWSEKQGGAPEASELLFLQLLGRAREEPRPPPFPQSTTGCSASSSSIYLISLGRLQSRHGNMITECGIWHRRRCNWRVSLWRQTLVALGCLCREKSTVTPVRCVLVAGDTTKSEQFVLGLVFRHKLHIWLSLVSNCIMIIPSQILLPVPVWWMPGGNGSPAWPGTELSVQSQDRTLGCLSPAPGSVLCCQSEYLMLDVNSVPGHTWHL